jgi:predicted TIM-barrel fold metal-dependent hydrolase
MKTMIIYGRAVALDGMLVSTSSKNTVPVLETPRPASSPLKRAPAGSTDCHFHIFGPPERFPLSSSRAYTPSLGMDVECYSAIANKLGLDRMVAVQPTSYGTNHSCLLHAVETFGRHRARAIAVIDENFTQTDLRSLDEKGVCGARVNLVTRNGTPISQLKTVAQLIAPFGWHLQLYVDGSKLSHLAPTLMSLPVDIVIDHMGKIPSEKGVASREFRALLRLLDSGKCWVKLCGYRCSKLGPPYEDIAEPARTLITAAPERCVWGTDWPHPGMHGSLMPDDGKLLDLLFDWAPDSGLVHRILVDNPARLYRFKA